MLKKKKTVDDYLLDMCKNLITFWIHTQRLLVLYMFKFFCILLYSSIILLQGIKPISNEKNTTWSHLYVESNEHNKLMTKIVTEVSICKTDWRLLGRSWEGNRMNAIERIQKTFMHNPRTRTPIWGLAWGEVRVELGGGVEIQKKW